MKKIKIIYILTFVSTILLLIPYCIAKVIGILIVVGTLMANCYFDKETQKQIDELERKSKDYDDIMSVQRNDDGEVTNATFDSGEY